MRYEPWGTERWVQTALSVPYFFTSQRWDSELGLYDYQARYYDAKIGRFISADSIVPNPANPQSLNRYAYVGNSPLNGTDPDGHCWPVCTIVIGAVVGAVIGAASAALPQIINNVRQGQPLTANIDTAEVAKAAAVGAVAGAVGGATFGVGVAALGVGLSLP